MNSVPNGSDFVRDTMWNSFISTCKIDDKLLISVAIFDRRICNYNHILQYSSLHNTGLFREKKKSKPKIIEND